MEYIPIALILFLLIFKKTINRFIRINVYWNKNRLVTFSIKLIDLLNKPHNNTLSTSYFSLSYNFDKLENNKLKGNFVIEIKTATPIYITKNFELDINDKKLIIPIIPEKLEIELQIV